MVTLRPRRSIIASVLLERPRRSKGGRVMERCYSLASFCKQSCLSERSAHTLIQVDGVPSFVYLNCHTVARVNVRSRRVHRRFASPLTRSIRREERRRRAFFRCGAPPVVRREDRLLRAAVHIRCDACPPRTDIDAKPKQAAQFLLREEAREWEYEPVIERSSRGKVHVARCDSKPRVMNHSLACLQGRRRMKFSSRFGV